MSIFQTLIGSAAGSSGGPAWLYPPPGNMYPLAPQTQTAPSVIGVSGYYEASSLTTPTLGLYRRTYSGLSFAGAVNNYIQDANFPATYSLQQTLADEPVGFGNDMDVASNFSMEWIGYFKPAVSGDFCFVANVDDYFAMWIGANAVTGFDHTNAVLKVDNNVEGTLGLSLVANRYYPVRLRYVEVGGGHNCSIWSGLKDVTHSLNGNQYSAATGQFFYDAFNTGDFPSTGIII